MAIRLSAQQTVLITPEQFFELAGAGLRGVEEERSSYWQPHLENSRRRILEAAAKCERRKTALILGAGNCTEIPLEELARRFDEVMLVDLDEESMAAAVEELPEELIPKVQLHVEDVTTFAAPLMNRLLQSVTASDTAGQAFERIEEALDKLEPQPSPFRLPEADLVVSSLVLSELHRYPLNYAGRLVRDKFGERLTAWPRYESFRDRLQSIALRDHAGLLARSCRRGGLIYFADTVARGPVYDEIPAVRTREVLLAILPALNNQGLFGELSGEGALHGTFTAAFDKIRARWNGAESASREETAALFKKLAEDPQSLPEADRGAACETLVNLLCRERFAVPAEIQALASLLDLYLAGPDTRAFESLVPVEVLQSEWRARGLAPQGSDESWWWLAYPCSISYSSGAFRVRSWILKQGN
ncbi:MAG: hypothetical protein WD733_10585 [Bryobacterales bacterium]